MKPLVDEFEVWSKPGKLLPSTYGKDLQSEMWDAGVPEDVFLGLSAVADSSDSENLKTSFDRGELDTSEFLQFCAAQGLLPETDPEISAMLFLEFKFGRPLAWIHMPVDSPPALLHKIKELLEIRGLLFADRDLHPPSQRQLHVGIEAEHDVRDEGFSR